MTFAAMGKCSKTGQIGGALATSFSVNAGRVTPRWHRVLPTFDSRGAIVMSHGFGNPKLAFDVFEMLDRGYTLGRVQRELPAVDEFFSYRQLNVITVHGEIWVHTGPDCPRDADHVVEDGWAVSGNSVASPRVVAAMAESMRESRNEVLGERLLRALEAGHAAGGMRNPFGGAESGEGVVPELAAVVFVVDGERPYPAVDLRVDYHRDAVAHLRRLYEYTKPMDDYYETLRLHPDRVADGLRERGVTQMKHFSLETVDALG